MITQITSPDFPLDEPSTAVSPAEPVTDPALIGDDELPFESPEFGVAGFLPHLDVFSNV